MKLDRYALERKKETREPMTRQEVADALGVPKSTIRYIEERALKKLRAALEALGDGNVPQKPPVVSTGNKEPGR